MLCMTPADCHAKHDLRVYGSKRLTENMTKQTRTLLLMLIVLTAQMCGAEDGSRKPKVGAKDQLSPNTLLFRALCLQEFPKEVIETVYGMHGQEWVARKLGMDNQTPIYLSTGLSNEFRTWRAPSPELINAIGSKRVRSVNDAPADGIIVIVEDVDWESANEVSLDIGTYHKDLGRIHGSMDLHLVFNDGKWEIAFQGGCYTRKVSDAD